MPQVTLLPGPRLLRPIILDEGARQDEDVTDRAIEFLFDPLVLGAGLRLRDLFGLFERCPALEPVYRRFYARELCAEAALGPMPDDEKSDLRYLELNRSWDYDSHAREYRGVLRLGLSGVGLPPEDASPGWIDAEGLMRYSLLGASLRPMLDLPLRLNPEVVVSESDQHSTRCGRQLNQANCTDLMLGILLQTVLCEMTWFGPPGESEETVEEMAEEFAELDAKPQAWREIDHERYMGFLFGGRSQLACDTLFESIGRLGARQVARALDQVPDRYNGRQWLTKQLGKSVRLRPAYRRLNGRDLRAAFSAARKPGRA